MDFYNLPKNQMLQNSRFLNYYSILPLSVIFMGLDFNIWVKVIKLHESPYWKSRVSTISVQLTLKGLKIKTWLSLFACVSRLHISLTGRNKEPTSCLYQ